MGLCSIPPRWLGLGLLVLAGACGETSREPGTADGTTGETATTDTGGSSSSGPLSIGGLVNSGAGGSSAGDSITAQSASSSTSGAGGTAGTGGQSSQTSTNTSGTSVGGSESSGGQAGAPAATGTTGAGGEPSCEQFGCMPGGNVGVECGLEEPGVVWVCTGEPWGLGAGFEGCIDMATQVPRYCCPLDFHPECL